VDLRKPGEEEDEYSEMAEEAMDPDNCFPDRKLLVLARTQSQQGQKTEAKWTTK